MTRQRNRKCKACGDKFTPFNSLQATCYTAKCALQHVRKQEEKRARKAIKEGRERLKTKGDHLNDAQKEFNRFIRFRDHANNCISCGRPPKKKNAGHYRSVGAQPALRFNEDNVHLQCEHCNTYKSGNQIEYRIRLVKKIGLERVEFLEREHDELKLIVEDIKNIRKKYRLKANELDKIIKGDL